MEEETASSKQSMMPRLDDALFLDEVDENEENAADEGVNSEKDKEGVEEEDVEAEGETATEEDKEDIEDEDKDNVVDGEEVVDEEGDDRKEIDTSSVGDNAMDKTFIISHDEDATPGGDGKRFTDNQFSRTIMDCGTCFSKYILCLFNFIILVAGAAVLFLGVWMYADKESLLNVAGAIDESSLPQLRYFTEHAMSANISYILMAAGGSMFILSLLGYCGALRESRCLLGFYGFLLVLILILEVTAAGLAFVYKDTAEDDVKSLLRSSIKSYYVPETGNENAQTHFLNNLMSMMDCCGVDDYKDFQMSTQFNQSGLVVPTACCIFVNTNGNKTLLDPDCPKNPTQVNSYFKTGCYETIIQMIKNHMDIVIYAIIGLVVVELLSTFLAFCLCKSLEPYDK